MNFKLIGVFLFAFTLPLPLPLKYSSIAFIIMIVNLFILSFKPKQNIKPLLRNPILIAFSAFFLLDIIRAAITFSFDNVLIREVRLAFIVLPIFFLINRQYIKQNMRQILYSFICGVFCYIVLAWAYVVYYYQILHPTYIFSFTDHLLVYILAQDFYGAIHHTYIGLYITLSALILFIDSIQYKKINSTFGIALVLFLIINSFFIGAKISTALLVVFIFLGFIIGSFKYLNSKRISLYLGLFFVSIVLGILGIREWLSISIKTSFESRLEIYKRNIDVTIEAFPFGISKLGLDNTLLNPKYPNLGNLIPHNIYFNEAIVNGIIGLSILLFILLFFFKLAIKTKNFIFIFFISIIILTGIVEDLFSRQRGILFFVFFSLLFYISLSQNPINLQDNE